VLHLSAGQFGSPVSDTLAALVSLQRDLGLLVDWRLLRGDDAQLGGTLLDGLCGVIVPWGTEERHAWYAYAREQAAALPDGYDVVVVHDALGVPIAEHAAMARRSTWIWHCHFDWRAAQPDVWVDLRHALRPYAAALFPSPELIPRGGPVLHRSVARPAIDPCASRHRPLTPEMVWQHMNRLGLDPGRPVIAQFAPLDPRYRPLAAARAYRLARGEVEGLQLVLADLPDGGADHPAPDVQDAVAGDSDAHVLTWPGTLGATDLNVLQRGTTIALQLAAPAGFAWALAEVQWKGKAAVVGRGGLLPEQVDHGASGCVVTNEIEAARHIARLLRDPRLATEMGRRGREQVAREHLITGLVEDYLDIFARLTVAQGGLSQHARDS
jgi:trehalose synthase